MSNISSTASIITLKSETRPFNPVLFTLFTETFLERFPRNNGAATISESFALNLIIYVPLTNK